MGLAHSFVLEMLAAALRPLAPAISRRGISDLALAERKVSGNSLRVKQSHLLVSWHAAVRLSAGVDRPAVVDAAPSARLSPAAAARCLCDESAASGRDAPPGRGGDMEGRRAVFDWPQARTAALAAEKYSRPEWNGQRRCRLWCRPGHCRPGALAVQ